MKKLIIPLLLIAILTGCAPSRSTNESKLDKATTESTNESSLDKITDESTYEFNLDKTYIFSQLSFKVSSTWEYKNIDGADFFYLPDGSMMFVSNSSLGGSPVNGADIQDNMSQAYNGFTESATNVKAISDNFDSINNIHTVTFTADYGKGTQYINYYTTVRDEYLYCIVLIGDTNSQDNLDKLFKEIITNVSLESNAQASVGISLTKDEIIKMMDGRLKDNNLPTFSNASKAKSTIDIEGFGAVTNEVYTLINGINFAFYSDIETDELLQVVYVVDRSKLSVSAYETLGYINTSLPYLFERDAYDDLDKKLDMNSDNKSYESEAAGTERKYYYFRSDNLSSLFVYPVGKEILVRAVETTPSPSAGTPATPSPSNSATPSSAPTQQQTQRTSQSKQNIFPQITQDMPPSAQQQTQPSTPENTPRPQQTQPSVPANTPKPQKTQPSTPANTPEPQQTTPSAIPTPVPTDNDPKFTANVSEKVYFMNLIILEGILSGISSPQDVSLTCQYPNGETYNKIINSVNNDDTVNYYFETEEGGLGSGYITVSLVSTGEELAKYNFTVIP